MAASALTDIANHASSPAGNPHSIPSSAMPIIAPHAVLYASLSRNPPLRPSNRAPSQCRPISINTSSLTHANGSTLLKLGQTTAVCGVRAEILPIHEIANYRINQNPSAQQTQPPPPLDDDQQDPPASDATIRTHNLLVPNLELSTGCSPFHLPGSPPSLEAQSLTQRLLSLLQTSRLIRLSDLCIYDNNNNNNNNSSTEKKLHAFWVLYIDTVIINHDGNLFDACALAMLSALRDTRLPRAWWDADLGSVLCSSERGEARGLRLRGCPVPMSFLVFRSDGLEEGGGGLAEGRRRGTRGVEQVLCDPDAFEEGCGGGERGCVVVDFEAEGRMVVVQMVKCGGPSLGREGLRELGGLAGDRWKEWQRVLMAEPEVKIS